MSFITGWSEAHRPLSLTELNGLIEQLIEIGFSGDKRFS